MNGKNTKSNNNREKKKRMNNIIVNKMRWKFKKTIHFHSPLFMSNVFFINVALK